jgi:predicted HAD superfamily phosphohydrolase YqeG
MPPERVAMVGDTLAADIAGGLGLGMRTICVTMVPAPWNADHRHIVADVVAPTLRHVERVLFTWAQPAG